MDPKDDPEARIQDLERPLSDMARASDTGAQPGMGAPQPGPYSFPNIPPVTYGAPYPTAPPLKTAGLGGFWIVLALFAVGAIVLVVAVVVVGAHLFSSHVTTAPSTSQGASQTPTDGGSTAAPSAATANISQWTADKLTQAFAAVDSKIGVHPADYIQVNILDTSVLVEAIDPLKRQNVDQYTYASGGGIDVTPVDVSSSDPGAVEESKFKSDTVDTAVLAQVINSAVKDSGVENGRIISVLYHKFFADQPAPTVSATVQGPRATKIVEYDTTGQLLRII